MFYIEDTKNLRLLVDNSMEFVDAASNGDLLKVKELLDSGVNPDAQGPKGWTALRKSAVKNKYEIIRELLNRGADVDAANYTGHTALMMACTYGHHEIASLLLFYGANPNLTNCGGRTALMIAASYGYIHTVDAIVNANSRLDITKADRNGKSALQMAIDYGHEEVATMLEAAYIKYSPTGFLKSCYYA